MKGILVVVLGIVLILAFNAFADKVTDKDEEERKHKDDDQD